MLQTSVRAGDNVKRGRPLVVLNVGGAREALEAAEARLAGAQAELASLEAGLPEAERAELESKVVQLEADLRGFENELRQTERLVEKNAAAALEVDSVKRRIERTREELALTRRKLSSKPEAPRLDLARARMREAEAGVAAVRRDAQGGDSARADRRLRLCFGRAAGSIC